jgi:hypothetical protein
MKCEERHRLWNLYSRSLDRVTACVNELVKASPGPNVISKVIASREADAACNAARYAWECHLSEHRGCSAQEAATSAIRSADEEIEPFNRQILTFAPNGIRSRANPELRICDAESELRAENA